MKKELKDYLHLYLGAEYEKRWVANNRKPRKHKQTFISAGNIYEILRCLSLPKYFSVKVFLRPLSDMTKEEKTEFQFLCELEKEDLACVTIEKSFFNDEMQYGTAHLTNIAQWANGVHFLLSKHFDLFGLIEAGLAIDKTMQES